MTLPHAGHATPYGASSYGAPPGAAAAVHHAGYAAPYAAPSMAKSVVGMARCGLMEIFGRWWIFNGSTGRCGVPAGARETLYRCGSVEVVVRHSESSTSMAAC
jgi:hypothetical protein